MVRRSTPDPVSHSERLREGLDIAADRWPDVSRVFSAAVGLDGSSRAEYLKGRLS
jgi:hypothetical protein